MATVDKIVAQPKPVGEIVMELTKENAACLRLKRGATYTLEQRGKRYCGLEAFRSTRGGKKVIVFRPGRKTTGPTLDGKSRLIFQPEQQLKL